MSLLQLVPLSSLVLSSEFALQALEQALAAVVVGVVAVPAETVVVAALVGAAMVVVVVVVAIVAEVSVVAASDSPSLPYLSRYTDCSHYYPHHPLMVSPFSSASYQQAHAHWHSVAPSASWTAPPQTFECVRLAS